MTISSHTFLLVFLPIVFGAYYFLFKSPRHKMLFLLAASYAFYALANWEFLPLLFALSFSTFWLARRKWFGAGILLNLAALGFFKYWNFGLETFNSLAGSLGLDVSAGLLRLALPLGISFFVFKHIGYLLDVQQGRHPASQDFWIFAAFAAYFPQIGAGPISRFQETSAQFAILPERPANDQIQAGLLHLTMGLAKKTLIADVLGSFIALQQGDIGELSGMLPAWYLVFAYAFQIYFDFSGYTDMALGVSMLFGIALPPNFNNPYLAGNPAEFWERWHISLSNWFKYYLFSPTSRFLLRKWGASRREWAQYASNFMTMTLVGLWHGAGWSYVLWGAYHGLLLNVNAWWKRGQRKLPAWLSRPLFILTALLGWALFMSPDAAYLTRLFAQLFGFGGIGDPPAILHLFTGAQFPFLAIAVFLVVSGYGEASAVWNASKGQPGWSMILWGILAGLSLLFLGGQTQFLYAQF